MAKIAQQTTDGFMTAYGTKKALQFYLLYTCIVIRERKETFCVNSDPRGAEKENYFFRH